MGCEGGEVGGNRMLSFQLLLFSTKHTPSEDVLVDTVLDKLYFGKLCSRHQRRNLHFAPFSNSQFDVK